MQDLHSSHTITCPLCHGRGSDVEVACGDCGSTGYDPNEDNPFAQCHTCFGEGTVILDDCPKCGGDGVIEIDDSDDPVAPEEPEDDPEEDD